MTVRIVRLLGQLLALLLLSVGRATNAESSSAGVDLHRNAASRRPQPASRTTSRAVRRSPATRPLPRRVANATRSAADSDDDLSDDVVADTFAQRTQPHATTFVAECDMPTAQGLFKMRSYTYSSPRRKLEPIVMVSGDVKGGENVVVRVHDACFTSEVFGSLRCDCREQLQASLKLVQQQGGVVIYLQQEGRGIGIANKVAAYSLQDQGMDTVDANLHLGFEEEMREYHAVPDILRDLGVQSIKLVTNNPFKVNELTKLGVHIAERVPMHVPSNPHNSRYMLSKRDRMHHILPEDMELPLAGAGVGVVGGAVPDAEDVSRPLPGAADAATGTPSQRKPAGPAYEVVHGHDTTKGYAFGKQSVLDAIQAVKEGKIVVVTDDEDRENEGDLIMAAEKATPELVGFIVRHTSGVLCVSMEDARLKELDLPPMVVNNEDPKQTAYTVSVDYRHGITTGISAADRAAAFRALADPRSTAADFQRPGHVFPLRYRDGGVLARGGHTEASLDLTRLAGLRPAGVLAEVVNDDGSVTRLPGLRKLAAEHGLVLTSVQDIIAYRVETERRESP